MKVLFCHDGPLRKDEHNNYYGAAHNDDTFSRYYNIANELGVAIRVSDISSKEANEKLSKISVTPFEVIECPNTLSLKGILFDKQKMKEIVRKEVEKADYIVARIPSMTGFIAIDIAKKLKKPYLVELVTCPWDAFWNHSVKGKLIAPFMYNTTKKSVKDAPYVVYVTNEFLQKRYPTKGKNESCSNVSLKEFDSATLDNRLKKISKINSNTKLVIGTTAAVDVRFKGQQYIIKALGELKKRGITNLEYQLVGGGNQEYLKSVAEQYNVNDQVKFLGALPHNKVFNWLDSIDLYTQPSRQEGLPRALIEAMSRGLPAFGARTAGIPELLQDKFIFNNTRNNINEICQILLILTFDLETMTAQSKRNYEESKKYEKSIIESRRKSFFQQFRKEQ